MYQCDLHLVDTKPVTYVAHLAAVPENRATAAHINRALFFSCNQQCWHWFSSSGPISLDSLGLLLWVQNDCHSHSHAFYIQGRKKGEGEIPAMADSILVKKMSPNSGQCWIKWMFYLQGSWRQWKGYL